MIILNKKENRRTKPINVLLHKKNLKNNLHLFPQDLKTSSQTTNMVIQAGFAQVERKNQ